MKEQVEVLNLPRGIKPSLIDRTIRTVKDHTRAIRNQILNSEHGFRTGGILSTSVFLFVIFFSNVLLSAQNPSSQSPFKTLTGGLALLETLAKHKLQQLVEIPTEELQSNQAIKPKTVNALALYPSQGHCNTSKWNYINLETLEVVDEREDIKLYQRASRKP